MHAAALPDLEGLDAEALKALLVAQHKIYAEEISRQNDSYTDEIGRLKLLIEKLRHMLFGTKSEKLVRQIDQLELQLEDLQAARAINLPVAAEEQQPIASKPSRRALPEHLPREVHTHEPEHHLCPDCGGALRDLGEDASEVLEYVRASFKVIRHVRPKRSGGTCERIVQATAPSRPIKRGLCGPGLLAHVLVSKYADHQPLYRQSEIYAREGVNLDRSTLAGWVGAASHLLTPLLDAVRRYVMAATKLHADDTPVPVLAPGLGKTRTGRLWTYVRDDRPSADPAAPAVWFAYSPDRKGEHPKRHLAAFSGTLQADAYAGFHHLYDTGRIHEAACRAHARRKFHEIHLAHPTPVTTEALDRIATLYAFEKQIRGSTSEVRREVRQARAAPLLDDSASGLKLHSQSSRKSPTPPRRSVMRSRAGAPSCATSTTDNSRSTTTPPSVRSAWSLSAARTSSSPDQTPAANARPPFTPCSARPGSTAPISQPVITGDSRLRFGSEMVS